MKGGVIRHTFRIVFIHQKRKEHAMRLKSFYSNFLLAITLIFVLSTIASCVTATKRGVTPEQLSKAIKTLGNSNEYKALGFFKINSEFTVQKNQKRKIPVFDIANSEAGKKLFTVQKHKTIRRTDYYMVTMTEEAIKQGAFKEGRWCYIPIGTVQYEITDQKIIDLMANQGQQNIVYANYKVTLNELGKTLQKIFSAPDYQNYADYMQNRTAGQLVATFTRKSPDEPWKM